MHMGRGEAALKTEVLAGVCGRARQDLKSLQSFGRCRSREAAWLEQGHSAGQPTGAQEEGVERPRGHQPGTGPWVLVWE